MKRMRQSKALPAALFAATMVVAIAACDRRPIEVYTRDVAAIEVEVDWMKYFGMTPSGMTLIVYDAGGDALRNVVTNDVNSQTLYLPVGMYYLTIFNHSADEFASIRFDSLQSQYRATVRANVLHDHALAEWEQPDGGHYLYDPEDIAVATDTIAITQSMIADEDYRFADYRDRNSLFPDTVVTVFPEEPFPMTVMLYVKAKVRRRQSVSSVAAYIDGMADGFRLNRIDRTPDGGTLYLPQWNLYKYGDDADSLGIITTRIATFGLPRGKELSTERDSTDNQITFHLTLTDGQVVDATFNVGHEIKYIYPSGEEATVRKREDLYDLQLELDLSEVIVAPPVTPTQGGAGFDAWVDEWDWGGTIEFDM